MFVSLVKVVKGQRGHLERMVAVVVLRNEENKCRRRRVVELGEGKMASELVVRVIMCG